ncbi:glycosyltransferase [Pseudomonas sp. HS6-2]|uniref:glycosyltransferase n=1 Tax=Pseudomonas sp. HS6-2 TaxID=3410986 RepID=UPI003BC3DC0B
MKSSFDPTWYLQQYPDVAYSQMDPFTHYEHHGRLEGRYPRALIAKGLEDKLWGGFAQRAETDLLLLTKNSYVPREEFYYACWALARWYASSCDWSKSKKYLSLLDNDSPRFIPDRGVKILKLQAACMSKDEATLSAEVKKHHNITPLDHNISLALASVTNCPHCLQNRSQHCEKVEILNEIYKAANLSHISLIYKCNPASIDNIRSHKAERSRFGDAKISIIMPAYNAADFIETAINSILSQTWGNIEVLVVNDCSIDDTSKVVQRLQASDSRISLIEHLERQGAYKARNTALKYVTGDYIANHDADDWSHPQRLEIMMQTLHSSDGNVAVIADWVRTTKDLNFITPRIEDSLIDPSVSTILFKRSVLSNTGGWDNVKVAADSEFFERIKHIYGECSVVRSLPGVPLVIARHVDSSLTNLSTTHWRTDFYGLRKNYRQAYTAWHKRTLLADLKIAPDTPRSFPSPPGNLYTPVTLKYDFILMGSFSNTHKDALAIHRLVMKLLNQGKLIGLFHWPNYNAEALEEIEDTYLDLSAQGILSIIDCNEHLETNYNIVLEKSYLANPLSSLPSIKFGRCLLKNPDDSCAFIDKLSSDFLDDANIVNDSGYFWPEWYLTTNIDVRSSGQDPLTHYLKHGIHEGRDPSPHFIEELYLQRFPGLKQFAFPPFLHYIKFGRHVGHSLLNPVIAGKKDRISDRPTILVAAHAAGATIFGAERCLIDVLLRFEELEYNIIITSPNAVNARYIEELRNLALKVIIIPCRPWHSASDTGNWAVDRFCSVIDDERIDFVLANTIMQREPIIAARSKSIPNAIYVHESPAHDKELSSTIGLPAEEIMREVSNLADNLFYTSKYAAENFNTEDNPLIISNIIDANTFDLPAPPTANKVIFGLISSNTEKKGILDLLKIAKSVETSTPNAQFLIIGPETDLIRSLKNSKDNHTISKNIVFAGYMTDSVTAISHVNVVLNLSHCQETFGRTVLEGMAARRPVIAYAWGAIPELVQDNFSGYLVQPLDTNAVADRVSYLSGSISEIQRLGENGRAHAQKLFSPEVMRSQLSRALNHLINPPENLDELLKKEL